MLCYHGAAGRSTTAAGEAAHQCVCLSVCVVRAALGWKDAVEDVFAPRLPHVKFILPTAPPVPITINMGAPLPAWVRADHLSVVCRPVELANV